jgi:hypothetical protein
LAKLPIAPDLERLRSLAPSLLTVHAGTRLHRIYERGGDYPTLWNAFRYFGPTDARFDHHLPDDDGHGRVQERGVLYLATDITTAIAEVFQDRRSVNRGNGDPWSVSFVLASELTLLNLTDTFCVQAGGSMKLTSGPTMYSQNWARSFYECYADIQGIYHPSSLTNRPILTLYERADSSRCFPETTSFHRALSDPLLIEPLRNVCKEIGYRFV